MPLTLRFATLHKYDLRESGITVPITLLSGAEAVTFEAKVDTGSSHCVFQRQFGEQLGFQIESGIPETFGTAAGAFLTYGHEVTLVVLGLEVIATVYFAADEHFKRNVLGRQGWLERVRLGLVDYDGQLYLSRYDDPT
jgi:hypothetical protein